ncbi:MULTISPECIES: RNA-guided endonuclease TnpB family protein [unclassified Haloferax]|uniref:RNA-guided endonuclease InsQ/TnpB family protein n=1 Tax=unclassified Haloferax TaxID=2625095 RepID=UPI000E23AFCA|nr:MULTISPECIES: RNA-guided endonuclease TnpB family protein [unclassified Haloferax]RDZ35290.1 transposase [Haloferax sp. Atlit-24N]RLM35700.1 transposase [Haloferax sp. Atlit-109R]RLM43549.1 transposase [Haloferax sp. Atlit-105R]
MEVKRTVPVKLSVPDDRVDDLHQTIEQFNHACNYTVQNGRNDDGYLILNKSKIHDEVYHDLRDETDLPANLCIRAYSKAVEAMKSTVADWKKGNSRPLPRFNEPSAVYDKRTLTIKDRSATLSTINGRVAVEYVLGDYQKSYLDDDDYERRMGTLHYREDDDAFYLHIVIKKEVEERDGDKILGVDLNLKNVAVTSTGSFYDGGELLWGQNHYFRVRRSLQHKGTRSAKQALRQLSGRENRFVLNRLHTISRRIVEEADVHGCSYIAVERLTHIRERMNNGNDQVKRQMHNWAFRELQEMLAYKAAEYGIRVEDIPPAFTSQTCSRCGHQSSTNRNSDGWFECNDCGYSVDGDYNASKNIGFKLLTLPSGKRPDGLGDGHLALKSGTLNGNGEYTAYSTSEADRESTDKPTTSVVG